MGEKYNFSKLNGKIVEVFGTQLAFAEAMGLSEMTISKKMNGKRPWKQTDMAKACKLLGFPISEIPDYFFATDV